MHCLAVGAIELTVTSRDDDGNDNDNDNLYQVDVLPPSDATNSSYIPHALHVSKHISGYVCLFAGTFLSVG